MSSKTVLSIISNISFFLVFILFIGCSGESSPPAKASAAEKKNVYEEEADGTEAAVSEVSENYAELLSNKGIGPVEHVELGEIDEAMVTKGKKIYEEKCTSCHKPTKRFIGPAPKGILKRRSPEWVMNMILNPEEMVKKDTIAKALLMEYNLSPMANQNLTVDEARAVLEYFRTL